MPRIPKPNWDKRRKKWWAALGPPGKNGKATEVYAPATIGENDTEAAWKWFTKTKADLAPVYVGPAELTVTDVAELYLQDAEERTSLGQLSPHEYKCRQSRLLRFVEKFQPRIASTLTTKEIERWLAASGWKPEYQRHVGRTVAQAFRFMAPGYLPVNPLIGLKLPTVPDAPERFAERPEAAVWLWWLRRHETGKRAFWRRSFTLLNRCLIQCGARPKELAVLEWRDIQFQAWKTPQGHWGARAMLEASRWKVGRKTGKSRLIYFSPPIARSLAALRKTPGAHPRYVFVHGAGRAGVGNAEPWLDGSAISKTSLRYRRKLIAWQESIRAKYPEGIPKDSDSLPAVERWASQIPIQDEGDNRLVGYRWRHTAASNLLMAGVDLPTIAKLLGTSPGMIEKRYGHLLEQHLAEAMSRPRRTK